MMEGLFYFGLVGLAAVAAFACGYRRLNPKQLDPWDRYRQELKDREDLDYDYM